jgi:hypothetical protein
MDYTERTQALANRIGASILTAIQDDRLPPYHVAQAVSAACIGVVQQIEKAMEEEG